MAKRKDLHYALSFYILVKRAGLSDDDRARIDRMSNALMERVRGLTQMGALEILFKLGVFLNQPSKIIEHKE